MTREDNPDYYHPIRRLILDSAALSFFSEASEGATELLLVAHPPSVVGGWLDDGRSVGRRGVLATKNQQASEHLTASSWLSSPCRPNRLS